MEKKSKQMQPCLKSKAANLQMGQKGKKKKKKRKRTVLAPVLTQAVLWHFITRGIGKQRALPASSSFLPISISCGLPIATSTPNVPPQLKQILSVLRGKVLTHSTKANLSGCVGIAAQRWAPPGAK